MENMTLREAVQGNYDIYSMLGVDKDTRLLKKTTVINHQPVEEVVEIVDIVDLTVDVVDELEIPVFLTSDYINYKRYMESMGIEPCIDIYAYLTRRGA